MKSMPSIHPAANARIHYLDPNPEGKKAVLLLHGLGADSESWPWQLSALADAGCRPLALDLPGFGRSPAYPGRWSIAKTANAVVNYAGELGISQFDVVGISMGGTVALKMALDFPERIDRLILINTFARLKPGTPGQALYFLRRFLLIKTGSRRHQAGFVADRIFPGESQKELRGLLKNKIMETDGRVYQQAMLSLGLFRAEKRLSEIQMPTLVISGEKDTTVALESQKKLAVAIPSARHVIISEGGHAVTIDHPQEVNQALLSFLAATMPAGMSV
jgi:pimeloyl-ACP methyl ester carboxylesterase